MVIANDTRTVELALIRKTIASVALPFTYTCGNFVDDGNTA